MRDLQIVLEQNREHYKRYNEKMPRIGEFVMGYRWLMAADTEGAISLALRVGREKDAARYQEILQSHIGQDVDQCLEELIRENDPDCREIAVSLSNLMSKPFNTKERLADRGISRTEGLNFRYEVAGKKVGIIGYGLYNNFFLGKCSEFHAFDFRTEREVLNRRIGAAGTDIFPQNIVWHLGTNALEFPQVLKELDIVIMTGCTIVNDTYRDILACCEKAQIRGIYGPSAELCPEYLFDLGYNYIFSASVRDKETYLASTFAPVPMGNDLAYMDLYELTRRE